MTSPVRAAWIPALLGAVVMVWPTGFGAAGALLAPGLLDLATAGELEAQQVRAGREGCDLARSRRLSSILTQAGERVTYISGPLVFQCEDGTRIQADSVVDFESTRFRRLLGAVEIDGPDTRLVADRVHQSDDAGRVEAWGSVEVMEKGSETRMVGDSLVLLESGPNRPSNELSVMGDRPYAVLRLGGEEDPGEPGPPAGAGQDPVQDPGLEPETPGAADRAAPDTVFADLLEMEGEDRFVATGSVQVRRADMDAYGDSLDFDREENVANLFGTPTELARIDGEEFDLVARRVDLFMDGGALDEILAVDRARLTGEDVEMDAPRIRIFMTDSEMDRLVAVRDSMGPAEVEGPGPPDSVETALESPAGDDGAGRPRATAEDFVLRADSIEVDAPGQALDRVFAVGDARGESLGRDSLNTPDMPEMIRNDWIEGDTVIAYFLPTDTAGPGLAGEGDPDGEADSPPDAGGESDPNVEADGGAGAVAEEGGQGTPEYRLDRLVAIGSARSLYRLAPQDTVSVVSVDDEGGQEETELTGNGDATPSDSVGAARPEGRRRPPAVHYVVGDRITIVLTEGDVERMEVEGQTRGIYLEPARRSSGGSAADTVPPGPGGLR